MRLCQDGISSGSSSSISSRPWCVGKVVLGQDFWRKVGRRSQWIHSSFLLRSKAFFFSIFFTWQIALPRSAKRALHWRMTRWSPTPSPFAYCRLKRRAAFGTAVKLSEWHVWIFLTFAFQALPAPQNSSWLASRKGFFTLRRSLGYELVQHHGKHASNKGLECACVAFCSVRCWDYNLQVIEVLEGPQGDQKSGW